jgi:hypothetical protein
MSLVCKCGIERIPATTIKGKSILLDPKEMHLDDAPHNVSLYRDSDHLKGRVVQVYTGSDPKRIPEGRKAYGRPLHWQVCKGIAQPKESEGPSITGSVNDMNDWLDDWEDEDAI